MEYTKWRVSKEFRTKKYLNDADGRLIAEVNDMRGNYEANAKLIVSAVNACIELNPQNPLAVAEGIKDMYRACERLISRHGTSSAAVMAVKALAKINKDNAPSAP